MPLYEYICTCGANREVIQKMSELDVIKVMCDCGNKMIRIIPKSQGKPITLNYYSENAEAYFTGPKQKARVLKEKGLREAGGMKLEDFKHG